MTNYYKMINFHKMAIFNRKTTLPFMARLVYFIIGGHIVESVGVNPSQSNF